MDVKELVNFIRQNDDDKLSIRILAETLERYWNRGWEKRDRLEVKLDSARKRLKRKQEYELELISEQVAREGYYGEYLKAETWKRYLKNDPKITEDDVKPKQ